MSNEPFRDRFFARTGRIFLHVLDTIKIKAEPHARQINISVRRTLRNRAQTAVQMSENVKKDRRLLSAWTAVFLTVMVGSAFIAIWLEMRNRLEDLEHIGAYVSGVGQLIIMIWIVATFYVQQEDLREQRRESVLQRMSLQQQTAITVYGYYKDQLERLSLQIFDLVRDRDDEEQNQIRNVYDRNVSEFQRMLSESITFQSSLINAISEQDAVTTSYIKLYVEQYESIKDTINSVDGGILHQVLISETSISDLYHLMSSLLLESTSADEDFR